MRRDHSTGRARVAMPRSRRPMLNWLRRLGFVDSFRMRKSIDGIDIPYFFYRLVGEGHTHTFFLESR